jgi:hypothetical protein
VGPAVGEYSVDDSVLRPHVVGVNQARNLGRGEGMPVPLDVPAPGQYEVDKYKRTGGADSVSIKSSFTSIGRDHDARFKPKPMPAVGEYSVDDSALRPHVVGVNQARNLGRGEGMPVPLDVPAPGSYQINRDPKPKSIPKFAVHQYVSDSGLNEHMTKVLSLLKHRMSPGPGRPRGLLSPLAAVTTLY